METSGTSRTRRTRRTSQPGKAGAQPDLGGKSSLRHAGISTAINPVVLLLAILGFSVVLVTSGDVLYMFVNFGLSALFLIAYKEWKALVIFCLLLALSFVLFEALIYGDATGWRLPVSYVVNTIFRMLPIAMIVFLLINTIKISQLISSLEMLRLPKKVVLLFTVAFRFLPTFVVDFRMMKSSLKMRGIVVRPYQPLKILEYYLVPVLYRCLQLAEELSAAGLVKGVGLATPRTSVYSISLRAHDIILCVALGAWLTFIVWGKFSS